MSLYFKFNNQLQIDMNNILMKLNKTNAIELEFDNTKNATERGTYLISVDGKRVNINYQFSEPNYNNIYFLFDKDFV